MEWKIGEIRQVNDEWYQCIPSKDGSCLGCDFNNKKRCYAILPEEVDDPLGDCDGKIFKKLEKVGKPYVAYGKVRQKYKLHIPLTITNRIIERDISCDDVNGIVDIEIKQNKEDMEEKKQKMDKLATDYSANKITYKEFEKSIVELYADKYTEVNKPNLKGFSLEAAKAGKPVCTRDGRKARIIAADLNNKTYPLAAVIENNGEENEVHNYTSDGLAIYGTFNDEDLMMLPEKKEGWVNVVKEALSNDDRVVLGYIFNSYEDAVRSGKANEKYVATVKIEWDE